ncbi:alpha/beta hydrolase family protein [Pedobacter faecalis]|uniref:alpha/beta hydrolase family protein n=1 Tax=Pedobacter faecalis TaxID=3041495 RepID=UPI00254A6D67|nr:prolyl oligopeptidase family serine peptidase [Pedobacter sp. ELA7]
MLKYLISIIICHCAIPSALAQKRPLAIDSFKSWESLGDKKEISGDGRYVGYSYGSVTSGTYLILQGIKENYRKLFGAFRGEIKLSFTDDSKTLVFINESHLNLFDIRSEKLESIGAVQDFKLFRAGKENWLVYKTTDQSLYVRNLNTKQLKKISAQTNTYEIDEENLGILICTRSSILSYHLTKGKCDTVFKSSNYLAVTSHKKTTQIAFLSTGANERDYSVWYYRRGMKCSTKIVDSTTCGVKSKFCIDNGNIAFTLDGQAIIFNAKNAVPSSDNFKDTSAGGKIWNYKSPFINRYKQMSTIRLIYRLANRKVFQLNTDTTRLTMEEKSNYMLETSNDMNEDEYYWNSQTYSLNIVSLLDGSKKLIKTFQKSHKLPRANFSPSGKYVVWADYAERAYFAYEIETRETRKISGQVSEALFDEQTEIPARKSFFGRCGWLPNSDNILVYDKYDIWSLDLSGKREPVNITHGLGRLNNVQFRKLEANNLPSSTLLISAIKIDDKKSAILLWDVKSEFSFDTTRLNNVAYYTVNTSRSYGVYYSLDKPQKSRYHKTYLVSRMSATESPNLFVTEDFKSLRRVSNIFPEKNFNWMYTELIKWRLPTGEETSGILYKPEDFDANKKYPTIFNLYEKKSDEANVYKPPRLSNGDLDISWYVSNGYLVFAPDFQYKTGRNSEYITNTIVSAVDYFRKFTWFDPGKLGVQGHSFGGYETNILITHTHLFRAAQQSAGVCNLINEFSEIWGDRTRQTFNQFNQLNTGTKPWADPATFIRNSPIFFADNVTTPLLIMHNPNDEKVYFSQGVELYAALRRLKRPTWLLKYDNEGHELGSSTNRWDFTVRQQQFFDHYLKNKAMPNWMVGN